MKLSEMKTKKTTIDGIEFEYRSVPGSVVMDYSKAGRVPQPGEMFETAVSVTVGWNLEAEDGTPMPVTVDSILKLPIGVIAEYFKIIMGTDAIPSAAQVKN